MSKEELLKMLHDGGMDDEAIKGLLEEALAEVNGPAEEEEQKQDAEAEDAAAAGKLLGVEF